jgi:hypothetical protein
MLTTIACSANVAGMPGLNRQPEGNADAMTAAGLAGAAGDGADDVLGR